MSFLSGVWELHTDIYMLSLPKETNQRHVRKSSWCCVHTLNHFHFFQSGLCFHVKSDNCIKCAFYFLYYCFVLWFTFTIKLIFYFWQWQKVDFLFFCFTVLFYDLHLLLGIVGLYCNHCKIVEEGLFPNLFYKLIVSMWTPIW